MESQNHYDVIIIGSGAGGGTLTYHLASSGKRILLLERGDYVPRETDNWNSRAVNAEGKYNTKESWRDRDGKELHPHTNYYVGGNTKFYGAALFRLRKEDFGEIRHHGFLHRRQDHLCRATLCARSSTPSWPIPPARRNGCPGRRAPDRVSAVFLQLSVPGSVHVGLSRSICSKLGISFSSDALDG